MLNGLKINGKSTRPIVQQIQHHLRKSIDGGQLESNTKLPSMRSLATELGVSFGIVKQAINTLTAEGYLISSARRGVFVAQPQTRVKEIALVLPQVDHEQMLQVIKGVRTGLRGSGYHLAIHAADADYADEINVLARLDLKSVAGVIIHPPRLMEHAEGLVDLAKKGVPCIQVVVALDQQHMSAVVIDGTQMGIMAFTHVLEKGHRKIGFLDVSADAPTHQETRDGIAMALAQYRMKPDALHRLELGGGDLSSDAPWALSEAVAKKLLAEHPELTAIIGADPHVTLGVVRAAKAAGKTLGRDLSVLGMGGDLQTFAMLEPGVSVVDVGVEATGIRAAQRLCQMIERQDSRVFSVYMPPELIDRESVASLKG